MKNNFLDSLIIKDKKILTLLHKTLLLSFAVCLLGILLMDIFLKYFFSFDLYKVSIIVFQAGLFMGTSAVMSSLIINKYNT